MKHFLKIALLLTVVFAAPCAQAEGLKVGHVNMQRIMAESNAGKEARQQYDAKAKGYQDQLDVKIAANKKLKAEIDAGLKQLKPGQKPSQPLLDKQKLLATRDKELQNTLAVYQKELREFDATLTRGIVADFSVVAERYGEANGYDYLIRGLDALIYANKKQEVTDALLGEFNNQKNNK